MPGIKFQEEHGGMSLMLLSVIIFFGVFGLVAASIIISEIQNQSNYSAKRKAFYAAESGIEYAMKMISDSTDWRDGISNVAIGDGTVTVTIDDSTSSPSLDDTVRVTSTGIAGNTLKRIRVYLMASTNSTEGDSVLYVAYGGNDVKIESSGTINGDVHARNKFENEGGATINGDVTTGSTQFEPSMNWSFFENEAASYGQVVYGDKTFKDGTFNGVWYVTNTVKIEDNATIQGTIVAENDIKIEDGSNITLEASPSNYPLLVSGNTIKFETETNPVKGLIYAENDVKIEAPFECTGAVIAKTTFKIESPTLLTLDQNYTTNIAGFHQSSDSGTGGDEELKMVYWDEN